MGVKIYRVIKHINFMKQLLGENKLQLGLSLSWINRIKFEFTYIFVGLISLGLLIFGIQLSSSIKSITYNFLKSMHNELTWDNSYQSLKLAPGWRTLAQILGGLLLGHQKYHLLMKMKRRSLRLRLKKKNRSMSVKPFYKRNNKHVDV